MKQGVRSIDQLYKELERQRSARKDIIADTRCLSVQTAPNGTTTLAVQNTGGNDYKVSEVAHHQLADRLSIPYKYYERLRYEYPKLLDENINGWLSHNPEKRLLRTLDNNVRAFLSDRYRRLDNLELMDHIMPVLGQMKGCQIESAAITETHLYIKVINRTLKAELAKGDVVQAGFVISNSEVGMGALKVEPLIYRLVCKNGLICKDFAHKKYHCGKQVEDTDSAYELYSDATLEADDKAYFMKVQDIVGMAVNKAKFALTVDKMKEAMNIDTGDNPVATVEVLSDKYMINKSERAFIMRHFIMGKDWSKYGLVNAVTRASQDITDYNRATEFERIGGLLLSEEAQSKGKMVLLPERGGMHYENAASL